MKQIIILSLFCAMTLFVNAQDITLPAPIKTGGMPLMEALNNRKTDRDFSEKSLDNQLISNLLWAAAGVNRTDGRRTAPTARNMQQIDLYVYMASGVYLYDANANSLKLIVKGDHRKDAAIQPFAHKAPLTIVYVANLDKMKGVDEAGINLYSGTDCGNICQNVYLFCASEKLSTVELGMINRDAIQKLLKIKNGKILLGQPVGYPQ